MASKYFAVGSVGSFLPDEEVVGLTEKQYKELLATDSVRVEEVKEAKTTKK
jgi:hypothetical protein